MSWFKEDFSFDYVFGNLVYDIQEDIETQKVLEKKRIARLALLLSMNMKTFHSIDGVENIKEEDLFWKMKSLLDKGKRGKICDNYDDYINSNFRNLEPGEGRALIEKIRISNGDVFASYFESCII